MAQSDRHGLPLLSAGQAQKEITHNEALVLVDRLLQLAVVSRTETAPPAQPRAGDIYIVPAGATGAWAGQADALASHDGFGWAFTPPPRGALAYILAESEFSVFDGGWTSSGWPVSALRIGGRRVLGAPVVAIAPPAGGTAPDSECRAVVAALLTALRGQGVIG